MDVNVKQLKNIAVYLPDVMPINGAFYFVFNKTLYGIQTISFEGFNLDIVWEQICFNEFKYDGTNVKTCRIGKIDKMKLLSDEEIIDLRNQVELSFDRSCKKHLS